MLRPVPDWRPEHELSERRSFPEALAFQIEFSAVCISPNTPEAVRTRVAMPITVAHRPDEV